MLAGGPHPRIMTSPSSSSSGESRPESSPPPELLALVAASILADHAPAWLTDPVGPLAEAVGVSPSQVSRLKARILPAWNEAMARATRRGRPPAADARELEVLGNRIALLEGLLALAASALAELGLRGRTIQDRLVAGFEKLSQGTALSLAAFARALGIPERTFREWVRRARSHPASPEAPPAPSESTTPSSEKGPKRNLGRFDEAIPGTQIMADTTAVEVLGIPLKLIGCQDPGDRHRELLATFSLSTTETADLVAKTADTLFEKLPGIQFVTDQGTPYMAETIQQLCAAREVEHAPAPEGMPTAKATLERSFGTLKQALAPLLELTRRAAAAIPALRDVALAQSLGTLLFATALRIYTFASRERPASQVLAADRELLALVAEDNRERSRSETRSRRLLLEQIHREYGMPGGQENFVRRFKDRPLEDLRESLTRLAATRCCCRIEKPDRYFAAILWRVGLANSARRARRRRDEIARAKDRLQTAELERQAAWRRGHPEDAVLRGLDLIAGEYRPERGDFHVGGRLFGLAPLRSALRHLLASTSMPDEAIRAVWSRWQTLRAAADPRCVAKVREVFARVVADVRAHAAPDPTGIATLRELTKTAG